MRCALGVGLKDETSLPAAVISPLTDAVHAVKTLGAVLGFSFVESALGSEGDQALIDQLLALFLELRKEARATKNWALADRIRDGLSEIGIQIKDHPGGESSWELNK